MRKRFLIALPLAALFVSCGSVDKVLTARVAPDPLAASYVGPQTYPVRWKQPIVTYARDGGHTSIPGVDSYDTARNQFKRWFGYTNGLRLVEVEGSADITIHFVKAGVVDGVAQDGGYQGYTQLTVESDTKKGGDPNKLVKVDTYIDESLPQWRMAAIGLHEFGHALGIRQHSPEPADIMYPAPPNYAITEVRLTQADVDSMTAIYQGLTTAGQ